MDFTHAQVITCIGITQPSGSPAALGDRAALLGIQFSDGSWREIHLLQVDKEQLFPISPTTTDSILIEIRESFGGKGAGFRSVNVTGYSCQCDMITVRTGEAIAPAVQVMSLSAPEPVP